MNVAQIQHVTATGAITTDTAYLRSVVISAGADAASATIRAGGASGTVLLVVKAATGTTGYAVLGADVACPDGIHVTVSGTTPDVTVVYV